MPIDPKLNPLKTRNDAKSEKTKFISKTLDNMHAHLLLSYISLAPFGAFSGLGSELFPARSSPCFTGELPDSLLFQHYDY